MLFLLLFTHTYPASTMANTLSAKYIQESIWKPGIFDGKVAFITGGAGSICRVQAEALVLLGANAVILGRSQEKTVKAAAEIAELRPGAKVLGLGGVDVREVKHLENAVEKTLKELGRIDIVIGGAAGNFLAPFSSLSARGFKTVIDIDLIGSYNTAKATAKALHQSKGTLIFVSATLQYKGLPLQIHASAAKAGVDSLIKSLAVELGPAGIRVCGIAPGPIGGTEGMERLLPKEMVEKSKDLIPLGHWGTTVNIADCTVFLASPSANFITGTIFVVDGGQWHISGPEMASYPEIVASNSKL